MSNVASPTKKDNIMEYHLQINLTEIEVQWSFDASQLDLLGTVQNTVFVSGWCDVCANPQRGHF